ncbi:unnamed protein product [Amoebophrya sp. A120]|nr:unnamed protein product [Amoebophrya sp. A120]|eukprot:GSA120T00023669001.1
MAPKKKDEKPAYSVELRFGRTKANLKMGIVGLPNVGKSSFFNLLTKQAAEAANFPFCTIKPNEGRCKVPDPRFEKLVDMWKPKSIVPAYLNITDIAGLVRGAHEGAGLGNDFLSHIQAVDGIYHMIRLFEDPDVTHVDDSVDPVRDLETITFELCQKDLATYDRIIDAYVVAQKRAQKKIPEEWTACMDKVKDYLQKNMLLSKQTWTPYEVEKINEFLPTLITTKPVVYLLNLSEKGYKTKKSKWLPKVFNWINEHGGGTMIPISVDFEQQLFDAKDNPETLAALKAEEGNTDSQLDKIIKTGYSELNLMYFFTCGEDEVRAWTVYKGATAPNCAGAIHTDMERCFIKAETCTYDDFLASQEEGRKASMAGVKAAGKYKMEGKQYVVKDGDILHIMHNAKK